MLRQCVITVIAGAILSVLTGCSEEPGEIKGVCELQLIPGPKVEELPEPEPCPGITIQVRPAQGGAAVAEVVTDAEGRFRARIKPGRYRVVAITHPSGAGEREDPPPLDVDVQAGSTHEVRLRYRFIGQ